MVPFRAAAPPPRPSETVTVDPQASFEVFNVQAKKVAAPTVVTNSATCRGVTRTFNLTVNP